MEHDPKSEYARRLEARREVAVQLGRRHILLGNVRLAIAVAAALLVWFVFVRISISPLWLIAPAVVFTAVAVIHARVIRARDCAARAVAYYERALDRLEDHWHGKGETGERFLDSSHPYSQDLDLFGTGSLFELLSAARTRAGEETLARWLCTPSEPAAIEARQAAVDELRPMLDLREDLAVLGEDIRTGVNPQALARWGMEPPILKSRRTRIAATALASLAVTTAVIWAASGIASPFLAVIAVEALFTWKLKRRVERVIQEVERPGHDLALLAAVLVRIERERFNTARLSELRAALDADGEPPSQQITHLRRLLDILDSRDNLFIRVIGPPLLWDIQCAFAIEAWRAKSGPALPRWLDAVGEFEALSSLAGFAYEHPAYPFPELAENGPCFDGEDLAHPLLPQSRCVPNDVYLGQDLRVLIVSGSNMSGKSTLLRTVGVNAVLAMAGAPVRARRLRMSPLALGASIRITDSLQGGSSRFYAEIMRLRQLIDLTKGPLPLLFLLDELLHGTNSHDRRIGAEGVVRGLVTRGAFGLLTTHDLALAHIAVALAPHGANVHFEDHLEDGRISFDYRLRPGVVQKSNALELMRSVGLEV